MTEIIRVREEHLAAIAELERQSFAFPWSEDSLRLLLGGNAYGVALMEDGVLCAYGGMVTVLDEGQILNIATHKDCMRRGYASHILDSLSEYARQNGILSLSLEVRESNLAARSLYLKKGYTEIGRRKGSYKKPCEDAILMEIRL